MTTTVYLHVGAPKTGTTYLQALCSRNRDRLAADGVLWPGRDWHEQGYAVRDLLGAKPAGPRASDVDGAWERLANEIHSWQGHAAVVSMELLVGARPDRIRRVVKTLAPADVRVVLTGRDIARTVPAQWQESVQNWSTWTWGAYLDAAVDPDGAEIAAGRRLWHQHDLGRILATWGEVIPPDRMHVITVPAPGGDPELLWHRFAQVVGIDPGGYDLTPPEGNPSLGAASAELMRRVNLATRDRGLSWDACAELLKKALAKQELSRRRGAEPALALPAEYHEWAMGQGKRIVSEVEHSRAHVAGDLEELIPDPANGRDGVDPSQLSDGELLEASVDGIAGMVGRVHDRLSEERREHDHAARELVHALEERDAARAALDEHRHLPPRERIKRCIVELSQQVRWLRRAHVAYKRVRR